MRLENETLSLSVSTKAAEMHSLIHKPSGREWIWEGDPAFWAGRNPILFPIIGSTHDKIIRIEGKEHRMGNHGFARHADFEVESHSPDQLVLSLGDSAETTIQYPFQFKLSVTYRLKPDHLDILYRIENRSKREMPFNFGLHPAFRHSGDGIQAPISVAFPCAENGLPESILAKGRILNFTDAFFETTPTLILSPVASPHVTLIDGPDRIDVSCVGYRWLAFWKKPGAHFLCIEPWHGHDDFGVVTGDFKDREGTLILKPGHSYSTAYQIKPYREEGETHV